MKLRVALITETFSPELNGVAVTVAELVRALTRGGHRVQLIRPQQHAADQPGATGLEEMLCRGISIPGYRQLRFGLPCVSALRDSWQRARPDVVYIATEGRWEQSGKLIPERTQGNQRRYRLSQIEPVAYLVSQDRKTLAYTRVSSHDPKADLERQKQVLELYCAQQGWTFELISDLGSGMNYDKKGLKRLLNEILIGNVGRLVTTFEEESQA